MHFYSVLGIHPNTGHQHRYNTGINFTYIPRTIRRAFANIWLKEYEKSKGNMNFTWERVQQQFPYLEGAVRRYMLKPVYYIQNAREVSFENMEDVIVSTWNKDFSKKLRTDLKQKFRRATGNAEKNNKKTGLWGRFFK
jgi:hypothetical protein